MNLDGEVKNQGVLVESLRKLFSVGNFKTKNVAVGVFGRSIITKKISVPQMSPEDLENQLYWEAEQYIPFNINEVNLDFAILGPHTATLSSEPKMDVLLVAAKKDFIQFLQGLVKEAGLEPVILDSQAFALGNAFEFNYGPAAQRQGHSTQVIIDFGASSTKVIMIEGSQTTFSRELQACGTRCSELLMERFGMSMIEAEATKILKANESHVRPILEDYAIIISEEVSRTIDFFLSQSIDNSVDGIYVCGGGSQLLGLKDALEKRLPAPISKLNPVQHIAGSGQPMNPAALREVTCLGAVATGLSLRRKGDK
ncbi:MAG: type IV pilus assembly protein PilM [Proteobacteria bacterium]|nr:type IV pilus assembly protein PilM [Pseudomonadota bacterium]